MDMAVLTRGSSPDADEDEGDNYSVARMFLKKKWGTS